MDRFYSKSFKKANRHWANLRGADLRWTDLTRASLAGANLTGASLRWAYLVEADLRGVIVADEQLAQATTLKGAILPTARCMNEQYLFKRWGKMGCLAPGGRASI